MDPEILGIFIPIILISAGFVLIGLKMTLSHLQEAREYKRVSGGSQQELEQLAGAVENLSAEVELLRGECLQLNERVDFTERLLESPKTEGTPPDGSSPAT